MDYKIYYRLMLLAPLVAILLVLGPEWAIPQRKDEFGVHLGLPLYVGVAPYCIFFMWFIWATLNKSYKHFMRIVWLSPILLIPFALATWAIMDYDKAASIRDSFDPLGFWMVAVASPVTGLIYISSITGLCKLLDHAGYVKIPDANSV